MPRLLVIKVDTDLPPRARPLSPEAISEVFEDVFREAKWAVIGQRIVVLGIASALYHIKIKLRGLVPLTSK